MRSSRDAATGRQEPPVRVEPARAYTDGADAAELVAAYGYDLDPWQRLVLDPRERENIGHGPSCSGARPGNMHVTEGMSLSAWMHEYTHFCQDRDLGFPPLLDYLENKPLRASMEEKAYGVEIERASAAGYTDLVNKLKALLDEERGRIANEDNF